MTDAAGLSLFVAGLTAIYILGAIRGSGILGRVLPALVLGLWGGALVDCLPRRRVLVGTQLAYAALAATLGVLALTGAADVWMVEALALGVGLVAVLDTPAALKASIPGKSPDDVTLDDVFVHYTGRALRDALQQPSAMDSPFMLRRP